MKCKKVLFLLCLHFYTAICFAQKVDTVVNMDIYKSYYSYTVQNPLYVTYRLNKGGGDCDRGKEGFRFKSCGIKTANDDDYSGTGYDKGHLANAEDFAYDCTLEGKTFCYFNCIPQTVRLNRGIWKKWETKLRLLSQKKPLFIIAGAIYQDKVIKVGHGVGLPEYCYKIVIDPKTLNVLYCLLFPNDKSNTVQEIPLAELKNKLGYPLVP